MFLDGHGDYQKHREAPFLSLWATAQDSELPARWPRRATGRAQLSFCTETGRRPAARTAQPESGPLHSHSPPAGSGVGAGQRTRTRSLSPQLWALCCCSVSCGLGWVTSLLPPGCPPRAALELREGLSSTSASQCMCHTQLGFGLRKKGENE